MIETRAEADAAEGFAQVAGHLGEFLQGRLGPSGPLALVTLPCSALRAEAVRMPGPLALEQPGARILTLPALRRLLSAAQGAEGRFRLMLDLPPGGGAGASTAARVAILRAAGVTDTGTLARACLASEGASDPLMFERPERLLWASREGRVLADLRPLPRMDLVGGFFGASQRTDPADLSFPDIADLVAGWATADLPGLARLATLSARRCLALRGPADDPTEALAARLGALGWAIGHTGPARALIFPPGAVPPAAGGALQAAGFSRITRFRIGGA
ncbi:propanediol utilization protein [Cereibacter sediminicola]|uniref:propanediol utilization protein n=1 Tax=Cereibacter sediminicola TaxID=2584941 RepID=UPI0011A2943B|nr:propanediol utilization protein [Cereibacter sediminicola]